MQLGHTSGLYTELYQPFSATSRFFVAPHAAVERRTADLYRDDDRVASYEMTSMLGGVDVGSQFSRYGEFRLGAVGGVADHPGGLARPAEARPARQRALPSLWLARRCLRVRLQGLARRG
ncbi:hypothetical protein D3C75_921930 [compost metagenome]